MAQTMQVQGPAVRQYRFGLQSAAQVVDATDEHEFFDGVTWEATCPVGPMSELESDVCDPTTGKALAGPNIDQYAAPFRGYTGLFCKLPGRENLLARANEVFDYAEWQFIENQAWNGTAGGSPFLAAATTTDLTPTPGTAVTVEDGGGLLAEFAANEIGQLGTVWLPRTLAYWGARHGLFTPSGPQLLDPVGNSVVLSAGGTYNGPSGDVPAAGTYWMYVTGPVQVRRMAKIAPTIENAFDRTENEVFGIVERSYLVLWGCAVAAVLVDPTV